MKDVVQCVGSLFVPLLLAIFTVIITFQQRDEASQQRLQDLNISRAQRDQDKQIAEEKRLADDINSEKQRNMSRDQRQHELEVEQQRYEQERDKYLDNLLLSYYNEIGELLKEANGTLSSHPIPFGTYPCENLERHWTSRSEESREFDQISLRCQSTVSRNAVAGFDQCSIE